MYKPDLDIINNNPNRKEKFESIMDYFNKNNF